MSRINKVLSVLEKVDSADQWSSGDGVAIGATDEGIFMLKMDTKRGDMFTMSNSILAPVTEEMLREWEKDTVEYEAEYYYKDVFNKGDDWDELSSSEQESEIEDMVDELVRSKMDGMSGQFDWSFKGKDDEYYLDMISGGQGDMGELNKPLIDKKDFDVLKEAWNKLHLKKIKSFDKDQKKLMDKAVKIYKKLEKNMQKMFEKSIQFYMLSMTGLKSKMLKGIAKKKGFKFESRRKNEGEIEQRELMLYMDSDGDIYKKSWQPITKNLKKHKDKGKWDEKLAMRSMMRHVEFGAKRYAKDFATEPEWKIIFPKKDREELAKHYIEKFENEN